MSVFSRFDFQNDVVENQRVKISSGIFSGGSGTLTAFYTASSQGQATGSHLQCYHQDPATNAATAEIQFAIGYAHFQGSGSAGNTTKLTTPVAGLVMTCPSAGTIGYACESRPV